MHRLPRPLVLFLVVATVIGVANSPAATGRDEDGDKSPGCRLVTAEEIRSAEAEQRTRIVGCVAAALADDAKLVARVRHDEILRDERQRAEFDAEAKHIEASAKAVRRAMKSAERASYESWGQARLELATAFASYAQASDRIRAFTTGQSQSVALASAAPVNFPTPRKTRLQAP